MAGSEIDIEILVERLQPEVVTDPDVGTSSVVVLEKRDIDDLLNVVCSGAFETSCKKWAGLVHTKRQGLMIVKGEELVYADDRVGSMQKTGLAG